MPLLVDSVGAQRDKPIVVQPVAISYTRLDGIPLGRYWRPLFAWFGDLDLVPHLWQMVCLGETEAVGYLVLDHVVFGAQTTDISFGRTAADPDVWTNLPPTPGAANP